LIDVPQFAANHESGIVGGSSNQWLDQSGVADEAKSVRRQIEHSRDSAEGKGWTVDSR